MAKTSAIERNLKRIKLENHIISMFIQKKRNLDTLIRKADWVT